MLEVEPTRRSLSLQLEQGMTLPLVSVYTNPNACSSLADRSRARHINQGSVGTDADLIFSFYQNVDQSSQKFICDSKFKFHY